MTGDQTYGLVADGSDWHEEGGVHVVGSQLGEDLRGVAGHGRPVAVVGEDLVEPGRKAADRPVPGQVLQVGDGEEGVDVLDRGGVTVVMLLDRHEALDRTVTGDRRWPPRRPSPSWGPAGPSSSRRITPAVATRPTRHCSSDLPRGANGVVSKRACL